MKRNILISLIVVIFVGQSYSQTTLKSRVVRKDNIPEIDGFKDSAYDSSAVAYVNFPGNPNYGDLKVPDLELKIYSLWRNDSLFLLFRHLDDSLVTGEQGSIKDGLENRDATSLYLYLGNDSLRTNSVLTPDSLTFWISWIWKTNEVEVRLSNGEISDNYDDVFTKCMQRYEDPFWYSEMVINLDLLVKSAGLTGLNTTDSITKIGFDVELYENDMEVKEEPFGLQTRAFFGNNLWEDAKQKPSQWGTLELQRDTIDKIEPLNINKVLSLDGISIYPNPVSNTLNIVSENSLPLRGRLLDYSGRIITEFAVRNYRETIDLSFIESGFYLLQLFSEENRSYTQSIIKL